MPILSPLGSLENLYEAILPKDGPTSKLPYYDPPDKTARALCPNIPAEGYLEPVAPSSVTATEGSCDQSEVVSSVGSSPVKGVVDGKGGGKTEGVHKTSSDQTKVSGVCGCLRERERESVCVCVWGGLLMEMYFVVNMSL